MLIVVEVLCIIVHSRGMINDCVYLIIDAQKWINWI